MNISQQQTRNQLDTVGGEVFPDGGPKLLNYVEHIFPGVIFPYAS